MLYGSGGDEVRNEVELWNTDIVWCGWKSWNLDRWWSWHRFGIWIWICGLTVDWGGLNCVWRNSIIFWVFDGKHIRFFWFDDSWMFFLNLVVQLVDVVYTGRIACLVVDGDRSGFCLSINLSVLT